MTILQQGRSCMGWSLHDYLWEKKDHLYAGEILQRGEAAEEGGSRSARGKAEEKKQGRERRKIG